MENADNMEVNVEHCIVLPLLRQLGIDLASNFVVASWNNFFKGSVHVYPELVRQLWRTNSIIENAVKGIVLGREITMSEEIVSTTIGCKNERVLFIPNWKDDYEGDVTRILLADQNF